jgi:hypothetical protein
MVPNILNFATAEVVHNPNTRTTLNKSVHEM